MATFIIIITLFYKLNKLNAIDTKLILFILFILSLSPVLSYLDKKYGFVIGTLIGEKMIKICNFLSIPNWVCGCVFLIVFLLLCYAIGKVISFVCS